MTMIPQSITEDTAKDIKKVAKGAGISLIGSTTGRGLWFLCQVIIARYFSAEVFGIYILGLTVLKLTELLAKFFNLQIVLKLWAYSQVWVRSSPFLQKGNY